MRRVTRLAFGAAILLMGAVVPMGIVMWPGTAMAAPTDTGPGLILHTSQKTYDPGSPVRLVFVVSNASAQPCGLSTVADGTVQITSVTRDGKDVTPALARSFYLNGLESAIRAGMVKAAPGSTVEVGLTALRIGDGTAADDVVLRSVVPVGDGDGLDTVWPVGVPGRYEVTAGYAVPSVGGSVTPCAGSSTTRTVAFTVGATAGGGLPVWWIVAAAAAVVLLLAVLVGLVLLLRRRRRHAPVAAALVLLLLVGGSFAMGRPAYADYQVDPSQGSNPAPDVNFKDQVDACLGRFAAPGGDPAGILPRLKDPKTPKVTIIPTKGGSEAADTGASKNGKGSSTVAWNYLNTDPVEDGVASEPCAALYHELSHADAISRGTVPAGECDDTGIPSEEVRATMAENRYRKAKGLPQRTEYAGHKLPKSFDECKKPKKKQPGPVRICMSLNSDQCGSTNGDPHLVTFDREYYDFQAVGEFVLARSTTGDGFEVQSRQVPLGQARTVSVNSALAFKVGQSTVDFMLATGVTQVHIDRQVVDLPRGQRALPGGGSVERREPDIGKADGYEVRWPDGSEAAVDQIGQYGYRLLIRPAAARAGKLQGLLGNFDGDPSNDVAPPTGAPLKRPPFVFDQLYPSYADSWRVTAATSLFTYAAGESTDSFTDRTFPEKPWVLTSIDPDRRAQAQDACQAAGVTDPWQLNECVLDVATTGRAEFAISSASSEATAPPVAAPIAATPVASGTLVAGSAHRVTFTGHPGQAVFVDAIAPTMPASCSPYRLIDPAGVTVGTGCNIAGTGYIDRTELKADGEYAVVLDPHSGSVGRASVRVYLSQDTNGTIALNGAAVTAAIAQPGAVARYTFAGRQGQRVFVSATSTLPSECSPLRLLDPAGATITGGCVISGTGYIDGTVLPGDGTYTVVVDPSDRTIGSTVLQLYSTPDQTGTIAVNGPAVVARIPQPGAVSRFTFTATAGTTVSVDATDSDLVSQCSPLRLVDPDGRTLAGGCVIDGTGTITRTVLPATGTYGVVVDPSDDSTGSVTLSLRG